MIPSNIKLFLRPAKDKKKGHVSSIRYGEIRPHVDIDAYWDELSAEVDALRDYYVTQMTVRSAMALDDLPVELEGDEFPLKEIAEISKRDPKRLIVDCSAFPQAASNVMKTIRDSGMNLNPQQDGLRIYVPIPKVTKEHREKMAKGVRQKFIESKEGLRKIQNRLVTSIPDTEGLTKDQVLNLKELAQMMNQHFVAEAEKIMTAKQKEVKGEK